MKYDLKKSLAYYKRVSKVYDSMSYGKKRGAYPANYYRFEIVKNVLSKIPMGRILDAGCGTGQLLCYLAKEGYSCSGCDFSVEMLDQAQRNLMEVTSRQVPLIETPLSDLSMFSDQEFDHVFCLGVFPYIPEELEERCYGELRRVMKPEGFFVTAHENEIFDTFTFNKYTLRFFERNMFPLLKEVSSRSKLKDFQAQVATLITHPEEPVNRNASKSARDIIFTKPENPITYSAKLLKYGFQQEDIYYYNFHALPPLLRNSSEDLLEISSRMEGRFSRAWQGMFMASTFVSVARGV